MKANMNFIDTATDADFILVDREFWQDIKAPLEKEGYHFSGAISTNKGVIQADLDASDFKETRLVEFEYSGKTIYAGFEKSIR